MRWSAAVLGVAIMVGLMPAARTAPASTERSTVVHIMGGSIPLQALDDTTTTVAETPPESTTTTTLAQPPVDLAAVSLYVVKTTPPDDLIRYVWRNESPATIERALQIACREGGMGKGSGRTWQEACSPSHRHPAVPYDPSCGADNPTSSASGLVQFMGSWRGWGGYDWSLIVGRDCWEDVQMFYAAYKANGWGPWT
jgi:hypothetical protein